MCNWMYNSDPIIVVWASLQSRPINTFQISDFKFEIVLLGGETRPTLLRQLPRFHIVTHDSVLFTNVKFAVNDDRMRPTWPFATPRNDERTDFLVSFRHGFCQRHHAIT